MNSNFFKLAVAVIVLLISATTFSATISNCTQLQAISGSTDYNLTADVDCTGVAFTPIASYTGTLNGVGYKIIGLNINLPTTDRVGLFGNVSSFTIKNIIFQDANIIGQDYTGVIVGSGSPLISNVSVINARVNGRSYVGGMAGSYGRASFNGNLVSGLNLTATGSYSGGMIGQYSASNNPAVDINDTVVDITSMTGAQYVGGVVGYNWNSYNGVTRYYRAKVTIGTLTGGSYVGGIVGRLGGTISDSNVTAGRIFTSDYAAYVGGLAGDNHDLGYGGGITNSWARVKIDINKFNGSGASDGYVGGLAGSNLGLGITDSWADANIDVSLGTYSGYYVGGLAGKSGTITRSYSTGAYIRSTAGFGGYAGGLAGLLSGSLVDSNSSIPLIDGGTNDYVGGLIGQWAGSNGILRSKYVPGSVGNITARNRVGGIAGDSSAGGASADINDCVVDFNSISGNDYVGGIVGYMWNGSTGVSRIYRAQSTITTMTGGSYIGGVVGRLGGMLSDSNAVIKNINASGYAAYVGGLAGTNANLGYGGGLARSWARVQITTNKTSGSGASDGYLGGLAGSNAGFAITDSWADVNIYANVGTYSGYYVGGLAGKSAGASNSYSIGTILQSTKQFNGYVGGLIGESSGSITDSNSAIQTIDSGSGAYQGSSVGGLVGNWAGGSSILRSKYVGRNIIGGAQTGGIVGRVYTSSNPSADVNDITVDANSVIGTNQIGGAIGFMWNSYNRVSRIARAKVTLNYLTGTEEVGGVIGRHQEGYALIDSNSVIPNIYAYNTGKYVGGIVGWKDNGSYADAIYMSNCWSINQIQTNKYNGGSTTEGYIGGLAGKSDGPISNSWADVNIDANVGTYSGYYVGGIVGYGSTITNSYAIGDSINAAKATNGSIGGIAGYATTILNTYSRFTLVNGGTTSGTGVGGLIGTGAVNATITNSYVIANDVNGYTRVGGIAGDLGSNATVTNSFFVGRVKASNSYDNNIYGYAGYDQTQANKDINCYFTNPTLSSNVYKEDKTSTPTYVTNAGASYFKGKTSLIRIKPPFSNSTAPDWNFNYTAHAGVWFGWNAEYPHFITDPNPSRVPIGEYQSKAVSLGGKKKCIALTTDMTIISDSNIKIQIQVADNNVTWWTTPNWVGPDGTSNTYYSNGNYAVPDVNADGNWVRWKAILYSTSDYLTPSLKTVDINCIPTGEMVLVANASNVVWEGFTYNALVGGIHGSLEWLYKVGNNSWLSADNNVFSVLNSGNPLYIKAKLTGTIDSNGPIIDNNVVVSYRLNVN